MRVLLISVDGMRPDAMLQNPIARRLLERATYSLTMQTVMPSVTLPCHMSMFHSVEPGRHGTTTNIYTPQVRPVNGLFETLNRAKKKNAFFYNWEELRDLARPDNLACACYISGHKYDYVRANNDVTDAARGYMLANDVDFTFLYLGYTDYNGHRFGWMTPEYMDAIENSWENIQRLVDTLPEDYQILITADHGGHERTHGEDVPEDMTIPFVGIGSAFEAGKEISGVSILDIAPTVAGLLGVEPDEEWEGKDMLK